MNITLLSIVVLIYILAISFLAWKGYKATKTAADFMVAGRGVHPYIMAISYGAAFISTSAIIGFGGTAGMFGLGLLWLNFLNILLGIFVAFVFFGKRMRKMSHVLSSHTFPEFLGSRYKSKKIQLLAGIIILAMVLYAAVVLIGAGRYLEKTFNVSFSWSLLVFALIITAYVMAGGLKGVMYTDALQGTIMFIGMIVLLVIVLMKLGGFTNAHKTLGKQFINVTDKNYAINKLRTFAKENNITLDSDKSAILFDRLSGAYPGIIKIRKKQINEAAKINLIQDKLKPIAAETGIPPAVLYKIYEKSKNHIIQYSEFLKLKKMGHKGWTFMPSAFSPLWWLFVSTIILGVGIGVLAQPQLAVRFMTIKSVRELNRSVLIGGLFIFVMIGVIYVAGAMSNAFFNNTRDGLTSYVVSGLNKDAIIPVFLKNIAPTWFNYLFMLTLLSAAMSTLSNQFHTMGIAISRDILETTGIIKRGDEKKSIISAKIGVFFMIVITLILGNILPKGYIAAGTALFFGLCTASFLPSLIGALFWKRATKEGALWSMITGLISSLFWLLFVHIFTVKNFAWKPILGKSSWGFVDPMIISLPISAAVFITVSLLTKRPDQEHVAACFKK